MALRSLKELRDIPGSPLIPERGVNRQQIRAWLSEAMAKVEDANREKTLQALGWTRHMMPYCFRLWLLFWLIEMD